MIRISLALILFATSARAAEIAPASILPIPVNKQQACVDLVSSEVCTKFEGRPGLLKPVQCTSQGNSSGFSLMEQLGGCAQGAGMSMWDTAKFLWNSIEFIAKAPIQAVGGVYNYLTDGDTRAAAQESVKSAMEDAGDYLQSIYPYLVTEYSKAYDAVGPPWNVNETSRAMAAAASMSGSLMKGLLGSAWNIIKSQYLEVGCFDQKTQAEMVCKIVGHIFLPPAAFYALLRTGVNGLTKMPALTAKLEELFKTGRKVQRTVRQVQEVRQIISEAGAAGRAYTSGKGAYNVYDKGSTILQPVEKPASTPKPKKPSKPRRTYESRPRR